MSKHTAAWTRGLSADGRRGVTPRLLAAACLCFSLAWVFPVPAEPVQAGADALPSEQLIVFTQPEATDLARAFETEHLPAIEKLAAEMGLAFIVKDVTEGALPEEVGITPLVVFQNHRGRSVYQGRYTTLDRLGNFVQTARFMPQGGEKREIRDAIGMRDGRATVVLPLKVTPLSGAVPEGHADAALADEIRQAFVDTPMQPSGALGDVALGRSDRLFYVDFYPYRSEDGTLYLSMAIFSQFHCHDPVYSTGDQPFASPWDKRSEAITAAIVEANRQVLQQINRSTIGDGFNIITEGRDVATWDAMGLSLPPKPAGAVAVDPGSIELVREWAVDAAAQAQRPAVQFAFGAPLDNYAGRAKELSGSLKLGEGLSLQDAAGQFVVPIKSVTMGDSDLDSEIFGWLSGKQHPDSSFRFEAIETSVEKLSFGEVIPGVLVGKFTMKGITIPLSVPVSIEAVLGSDGRPRMTIDGRWVIDITDPFKVAGPDGPADVARLLIYQCHIVLAASK